MSIEAMKQAVEALEWGQPIIEDYGSKEQLQAHLSAKDALYKAIEADMYRNPDTGNPCEGWDTSDMAHRSGGLSVEQEPVANWSDCGHKEFMPLCQRCQAMGTQAHSYTAPPKREWVGLTDEEIDAIGYKYGAGGLELMNELTSKLKEKNT